MSKVLCVAGESGSGKTTSMRNLDPGTTFYIDADRKGLSWKGWKAQYNAQKCNYMAVSKVPVIESILDKVNKNPKFKVVIIDTLNAIMIDDEFNRAKEKGYDKWLDLATSVWGLVSGANELREDLTVIFTAHTQTERDDQGYAFTRIKTSGRKLDKIALESKFTTVLISKAIDGRFVFETQARNSTAKSPMGAFESFEIENDIVKVLEALKEY